MAWDLHALDRASCSALSLPSSQGTWAAFCSKFQVRDLRRDTDPETDGSLVGSCWSPRGAEMADVAPGEAWEQGSAPFDLKEGGTLALAP